MKQKITVLLLFNLIMTGSLQMKAQSSVNSSGDNATGTTGSSSYSVGQIMYTQQMGTSGSILNGVQQPSEISIVLSVATNQKRLEAVAYPNPAIDFLQLKIKGVELVNLTYRITDINGKTITIKKITEEQTNISMQHLPAALYLVSILKNNRKVKTFKIFKERS